MIRMEIKRFMLVCILFNGFIQVKAQLIQSEFKISSDKTPSTIIQTSPKLFHDGSKRFLTTWKDYRDGEVSTYAQWFDSLGNAIGTNFNINSDVKVSFNEDGSFIALRESSFISGIDVFFVNIYATTYDSENKILDSFILGEGLDLTLFPLDLIEKTYDVASYSGGYIFFSGLRGLRKFAPNGILINDLTIPQTDRSIRAKLCVNKRDDFILTYFNEGTDTRTGETILGIFGSFFSNEDSLLENRLIDKFSDWKPMHYLDPENAPELHAITINDSLYQVLWLYKDSVTLQTATFNREGIQIGAGQQIALFNSPLEENEDRIIRNFTVSNITDEGYSVFVTLSEGIYFSRRNRNTQVNFDKSGNVISIQSDTSKFLDLGKYIFKRSNNNFFTVKSHSEDIILSEVENFKVNDIKKVNDDIKGSNESEPRITDVNENTIFVSWRNETGFEGVKLNTDGTLTGNQVNLKGIPTMFSLSGKCLNLWKNIISKDSIQIGYTIYDSLWNIIEEDVLATANDLFYARTEILKLSDSLFILGCMNGNTLLLKSLDINFQIVKEYRNNLYTLRFTKEDEHSFWLHNTTGYFQLFSDQLEPVSEVYRIYYSLYLGNNEFLHTQNNYTYAYPLNREDLQAKVFSLERDTLVEYAYLASRAEDYKLTLLPNNDFLVMWQRENNQLYARTFTNRCTAKIDSFAIHSDHPAFRKNPSAMVKNDKVYFAWADARNSGRGYDIYGSSVELSKVVNVDKSVLEMEKTFQLLQNYPNPFNPVTTINYSIPENSIVQLKVYNIIGREVATLVNEEKSAGEYTVNFDASHLSSGIYIYKITAGTFTDSRKMIVLK